MSDILEGRVCAVCRSVLDHRRPYGQPDAEGTWEHSHSYIREHGEPDHEPQPVPMGEFTSVNAYCDFCSSHDVAFTYRVAEVSYELGDEDKIIAKGEMSRDWAACPGCARLIDARNINGLVARVVASFKRKHGWLPPGFDHQLGDMYRGMMRAGVQKGVVTPEDPFGQKGLR